MHLISQKSLNKYIIERIQQLIQELYIIERRIQLIEDKLIKRRELLKYILEVLMSKNLS